MSATAAAAAAALRGAQDALRRGDHPGAEAKCREAIALGRDDAPAWALLGSALRRRDPLAAESALRAALERDPGHADAHFQLGNLQREQGRHAEAVSSYERALARVPGHASLLNNLGLALEGVGDAGRAETCYRNVLESAPQHRQALGNLAHLLCRNGEYAEALRLSETYLAAFADADATIWLDHGICLQRHLNDSGRAEASYRRALALAPADAPCIVTLATLLIERGEHDEAARALARAVGDGTYGLYAMTLLALARQHLCEWTGLGALHADVARAVDACGDDACLANPFAALAMPLTAKAQQRVARGWSRYWWPARTSAPRGPRVRTRGAKLRLGYISSDFRTHPIAFLLTEVWERHDRSRFDTIAYSIGPRESTPLRARIEKSFDRFVDCFDESAAHTAQRIGDDGIDVLIDLNGYTQRARPEILARRVAPVQIDWLGYLGTMGAPWIDYVLTDRFVTPESEQAHYDERLLFLPDCYCPSDTRRDVAPERPARADVGLPDGAFVYCCFNSAYKILPRMFDIWMRLLDDAPESVLWLSPGHSATIDNLRREARARKIDPQRLVLAPHVPPRDHFARLALADLFLDTLPYNAGTTANDALFAGLPVLTCAGATMAGRVAASQLRAAGLHELVTSDVAAYESRALALARDPDALRALRGRLQEGRGSAPLFDMARFTHALESALDSVAR